MSDSYLPNIDRRVCTQEMKVLTAYRYIRNEYNKPKKWINYVGLRYDEPHRKRPEIRESKTIKQYMRYPLFEMKKALKDVRDFWTSGNMKALDLKLPMLPNGKTVGGNCIGCFLKSEYENTMLCRNEPEQVEWLIEMEEVTGATFKKDMSWKERMKVANEHPMFDFGDDDMHAELLCTNDYGSCTED